MRATQLQFRSPKQATPDPYTTNVTYDGRVISPHLLKSSMEQSKRFRQYRIEANRTGFRIGPGSYDCKPLKTGTIRIRNTPVYKKMCGNASSQNNAYVMIGNHLVYQPSFVLGTRRTSREKHGDNDGDFSPRKGRKAKSQTARGRWFLRAFTPDFQNKNLRSSLVQPREI